MKELPVKLLISMLFIFCCVSLYGQTISQSSSTSGLGLHIDVGSKHWKSDDLDVDQFTNALAFRGGISYGFNEFFGVGLNFMQSSNIKEYADEAFRLSTFQLEGRINLSGTQSAFRPSIAAILNYSTGNPKLIYDGVEAISKLSGLGIGFEANLKYYLNPQTALGINFGNIFGNYTNNVFAGQVDSEKYNYSIIYTGLGVFYQIPNS